MAVPFYLPDQDDNGDRNNSNYSPNMTSSATQTPLQSPVSGNHLYFVQAFCDALYRCSINGSQTMPCIPHSPSCTANSPCIPHSPSCTVNSACIPHSPSCTTANSAALHNNEEIFFPRHRDIIFHPPRCDTVTTQTAPTTPTTSNANQLYVEQMNNQNNVNSSRRVRHSSTCDSSTECGDPDFPFDNIEQRIEQYARFRDHLQEFSGRIPIRKSKKDLTKTTDKHKIRKISHSLAWPTFVTVFVFAVGCSILVTR